MARLLLIYILMYLYGMTANNVGDPYLMGSLIISLVIAAIPNFIAKLPSRKKENKLVDTTTVNAALLRRKLDSGGSFELIINNESIELVGE